MAFTAVAALIAGAEVTAPLVLAAVAEVGTALTVVGAVTGSKDLMKVGGVLGLVGGVGSMVTGAMSASGAAAASTAAGSDVMAPAAIDAATGSGAGIVGDAATSSAGADLANLGSDVYSGGANAASLGGDINAGLGSAADAAGSGLALGDTAPVSLDTSLPTDTSVAGQTAAAQPLNTVADVTTPAGTIAAPSTTPPMAPGTTNPTDARLAAGTQTAQFGGTLSAPIDSTSYLQKVMSYVQDPRNKTVLELGAKLVGGALQGAQSQSQFNTKVDLEKQRLAQTSYGSQVGQNRPRGIIGGARS